MNSVEQSVRNTSDISASSFTLTLLLLGMVAVVRTERQLCWLSVGTTPFAIGYSTLKLFRRGLGRHQSMLTFGKRNGQTRAQRTLR